MIFRQQRPPGRLGLSDFTGMADRGVHRRRTAPSTREWCMAKAQFAVLFGERFTTAMA